MIKKYIPQKYDSKEIYDAFRLWSSFTRKWFGRFHFKSAFSWKNSKSKNISFHPNSLLVNDHYRVWSPPSRLKLSFNRSKLDPISRLHVSSCFHFHPTRGDKYTPILYLENAVQHNLFCQATVACFTAYHSWKMSKQKWLVSRCSLVLTIFLRSFTPFHQASVQRLALHRQRIYRIHTSAAQQRNHQHLKPRTTRLAVECPTMYDKCLYIFVRNVVWPCAVFSIHTMWWRISFINSMTRI